MKMNLKPALTMLSIGALVSLGACGDKKESEDPKVAALGLQTTPTKWILSEEYCDGNLIKSEDSRLFYTAEINSDDEIVGEGDSVSATLRYFDRNKKTVRSMKYAVRLAGEVDKFSFIALSGEDYIEEVQGDQHLDPVTQLVDLSTDKADSPNPAFSIINLVGETTVDASNGGRFVLSRMNDCGKGNKGVRHLVFKTPAEIERLKALEKAEAEKAIQAADRREESDQTSEVDSPADKKAARQEAARSIRAQEGRQDDYSKNGQ